jgi:hypothetical protein
MDDRNSKEGRIVRQKYADILDLSRPEPVKPRMTTQNRAKIFSPFAALRGYEEEIADQQREHGLVPKMALSEEDQNELSDQLLQMKKGMTVTVRYFKTDSACVSLGSYETLTGTLVRMDPVFREIEIEESVDGEKTALGKSLTVRISFDNLVECAML